MNEYISISEFANRVNLSSQAIYKRLSTDLKEYTTVENGKKVLNIKALELFEVEEKNNQVETNLTSIIDLLKEQLKAKDKQIEQLQQALELQQQLNAATLQTFQALPSHNIIEQNNEEMPQKKQHWWSKRK